MKMNILSVSELTQYIKQIFETNRILTDIYIRGEISNFKRHYSGHCYFTLKDSQSAIRSVMFKSRAGLLKFEPKDGLKVVASGRVTVFERDGQYQLYVERLMPEGLGELSLAYLQLKEKLSAEGLFDDTGKKTLPLLPATVGIITSPTGAALRDIITVSKRRHPGISLLLCPVLVQGVEAPSQIVQAIRLFNELNNVDVIIAGRGGGSLEELWAFNNEGVVRAIAASDIPIISAVGHETDYTLSDFAADRRAATPSQAAEIVVPDIKELTKYLFTVKNRLISNMGHIIDNKQKELDVLKNKRIFKSPDFLLEKQQALDNYMLRLEQSFSRNLQNKRQDYKVAMEKLAVLNPLSVLARGYGIVLNAGGKIVSDASNVKQDEFLKVMLSRGTINVRVLDVGEE